MSGDLQVPEDAVWFGVEFKDGDEWRRVDSLELGGRWWRVQSTPVADVVARCMAAGDEYRVIWTPEDRREKRLGVSLPIVVEEEDAAPPPAPRVVRQPPAVPPRVERAMAPQPPVRVPEPRQAAPEAPHVAPVVPMPFSAPQGEMGPLGIFVYIHSLVHQANLANQQSLSRMHEMMLENERNRSRENIESMRLHFQATMDHRDRLDEQARELRQPDPQVGELVRAVGELARGLEMPEEEVSEAMHAAQVQAAQQPQVQGALPMLIAFLQTPMGRGLAALLMQKVGIAEAPAAPPAPAAAE